MESKNLLLAYDRFHSEMLTKIKWGNMESDIISNNRIIYKYKLCYFLNLKEKQ